MEISTSHTDKKITVLSLAWLGIGKLSPVAPSAKN